MGWSVGYDANWHRDIGYGVPSCCDQPGCSVEIDRGLSYVCGSEAFGGELGCGLYFCWDHLLGKLCDRCSDHSEPHEPTADLERWTQHKLTDPSWAQWRKENGFNKNVETSTTDQGDINA